LLWWGDTAVSGNVVNAMFWNIIRGSRVISILISWFKVVSGPWLEVWQWSSINCGIKLGNHVVNWINGSISTSWLWAINGWLSNLLWWGDTAVTSNVMDAMFWDIVRGSGVISVLISRFEVVSCPRLEVGQWGSIKLSNHVVDWINGSISTSWLWAIYCWLSNLFWWSNTTVSCNVMDAVFWDIVWCSRVISVLISRFEVVSSPWLEVWQWSSSNLSNHVVDWINGSISTSWLWAIHGWLSNLLWWGDTAVTSNVMDAMFWDIVWCSRVISVLISRFEVVSSPWLEVGQWSSFMVMSMMMLKLDSWWEAEEGS